MMIYVVMKRYGVTSYIKKFNFKHSYITEYVIYTQIMNVLSYNY